MLLLHLDVSVLWFDCLRVRQQIQGTAMDFALLLSSPGT